MKSKFDELLPFYVNGTLAEADRAFVEEYLREHPTANAELRWYQSLQTKLHEDVPAVSSEVGLERAMQRIHSERQAPQRSARGASLYERLYAFFASITPQPLLRPALVGALAVVAVQAGIIFHIAGVNEDASSELRALKASTVVDTGPYLKVNFKPDAREADIRLLLVEVNGSLAAGPGQLGDYYVKVPAAQVDASGGKLKASAIVEQVAVVDGLPARP
jgi:hypothetical protein